MRLVILIVVVVPLLHGCVLFSKTEVVHPNAVERPVLFESQDAEDVFREAVRKQSGEVDRTQVGSDLLTVYDGKKQLSEAARFNRAVSACDINHDGSITLAEAVRFAERVK